MKADSGPGRAGWRNVAALVAAALLLGAVVLLPGHPKYLVPATFARLPLELPALLGALALARGRPRTLVRAAAVATLGVLLLLRLLDLGSYFAFDRRFSPLVELHLLGDGWNLASGAVGRFEAALGVAGGLLLLVLLVYGLWRATGVPGRLPDPPRRGLAIGCAAILVGAVGVRAASDDPHPALRAEVGPELVERVNHMVRAVVDQREFVASLGLDPVGADAVGPGMAPGFGALAGRDVNVIFVEAYGRSALDHERFATRTRKLLDRLGERLDAAGLHVASAWTTSPIRGGRSWLAQATFAAGLEVDDQARFDRLLASDRRPLSRLFGGAGWRTAAFMPAIVEAWPEAEWYGFDRVLDGHTSGYAGERFGWVTMPDQYTLSALQRLRDEVDRPLMSTVALISTHAPWTPVPRIVDWDAVGDGSIFDGTRRFGEPVTWTRPDEVRAMYSETIDYTLETIVQYLERHAQDDFSVVLGDHQPASIIDGWGRTGDVPVHIVTDDPALIDRLPADAFTRGMVPADEGRRLPMRDLRELLSSAYEAPVGVTP